jgi:hypothetical protein
VSRSEPSPIRAFRQVAEKTDEVRNCKEAGLSRERGAQLLAE